MLVCAALLTLVLLQDLVGGGHEWRQGDWLINLADGPVRRGPIGSAILALADLVAQSPLALVVALQITLLLILAAATLALARPLIAAHAPTALLFLSPGFFFVFWASDPGGSGRKELLMFTAFALLLLSHGPSRPPTRALRLCALLLAVTAGFAHEANVLLLPAFLACLILILRLEQRSWPAVTAAAFMFTAAGAAALAFAAQHPSASPTAVCAPLLAHGLSPSLCSGSIAWLTSDPNTLAALKAAALADADFPGFALAYALVLLPIGLVCRQHSHAPRLLGLCLLSALPFLPLYLLAADWGRWLSFHIVSLVFLLIALRRTGLIMPERQTSTPLLALLLLAGLLWSPRPVIGLQPGGPLIGLARQTGILDHIRQSL
jgi:hypothetical protein